MMRRARIAVPAGLMCLILIAEGASNTRAQMIGDEAEPSAGTGPHPEQGPGRQVSADELRAALQRYAREPSVERVIAAALAHGSEPRADALASRARTAGWVPTV